MALDNQKILGNSDQATQFPERLSHSRQWDNHDLLLSLAFDADSAALKVQTGDKKECGRFLSLPQESRTRKVFEDLPLKW